MQAIGPDETGAGYGHAAHIPVKRIAGRGLVGSLPSPARRLVRRLEGFIGRQEAARAERGPRRFPIGRGSALTIAFVAAAGLYGSVLSGSFGSAASHTAAGFGLGLGDVAITGILETSAEDVYGAIGLDERPSLVGLDLAAARGRLLALPWIRKATLRTVYPGRLAVDLDEREAFAVWQSDRTLTVVERTGRPITAFGIEDLLTDRFSGLPNVVGEGAADHAADLLPVAARHSHLALRISAYVRVADRRWDVVFDNGLRLKLPEFGIADALSRFAKLEAEQGILARPIETADMRDPSRLALRLRADIAEQRAVEVAKLLKAMRAAEPKRGAKRL